MFNSVRFRLTVWYTAVMTLVLVILAAVTYLVLQQNVVRRADAQAIELADSFLSTVDAEMGDGSKPESVDQGIAAAISEHRFTDVVFVVFSPQGQLLGASKGSEHSGEPTDPPTETLLSSLRPMLGDAATFHSLHVRRRIYRGYIRHFSIEGDAAILVVLQSLHRQTEFLETLVSTFLIIIPLTIALAAVGGYLLARRSLSPVVAMSNQASHIGAENLHDRLVIRNPRDELGRLAASFNELLDRLDQSFERQRRFVADASHELRTPVAILCGEAEVTLAQDRRTEQEYRESLQILGEEAKRLKHIVEDLFTLARADAGQHPLALTDFYLDELAAECSKNVRTLASAKDIEVTCEARGEVLIRGDEPLLRRMLLNLLDNAIKYTSRGGKVALRSGEENGCYRLSVEDTGPGIPADLQLRIFERFFRIDKARSRGESDSGGAGLGLAIASWIAEAHGGRLELTRSTSVGSVFTVYLPNEIPKS
jgi:two-component system, OmpR family, sensor kinase